MEKKLFCLSSSFEFLRRSMALMSPAVLILVVLSFNAFTVVDPQSWKYTVLTALSAGFLLVVFWAIWIDYRSFWKNAHCGNRIINTLLLIFFFFFIVLVLGYSVLTASTLYSSIFHATGK
ncbi:hypothetical protein ACB404_003681 [Morganella morganii]|uniref:hypothetical protein n=1 Tax=Morganella morganii TaxID=582 RepID=UPI0024B664EC|nr:hypothetical protein [Morganella morganii]MDI9764690.1 hypothetical protein [Morganella morganii]